MLCFFIVTFGFILLLTLLYLWLNKKYSFWSSRGVSGPSFIPLLGNVHTKFALDPLECELSWTKRHGKLYGIYYGVQPALTILDADLIRQVMISDFARAVNRRYLNTYHEIFNRNLFHLEDDEWKRVRAITTRSFTSGKLRVMQGIMQRCIDKLDQHLLSITSSSATSASIDACKIFSGFTIDSIAATVFATEVNVNDENDKKFMNHALQMFRFPPLQIVGMLMFPRFLNRLLNITGPFPQDSFEFFLQLAQQIVQQRMSNRTERREDLVQLMIDAYVYESELESDNYEKLMAPESDTKNINQENQVKKKLSEEEIVAQCLIFFTIGYETSANTLAFCVYELAMNPVVQERLHQEISSAVGDLEIGSMAYFDQVLTHSPYLEAVIKETLRKYPTLVRLERRISAENFDIAGIQLPKNSLIEVPILGVHYNPEYYPEPELFKPERWLGENRHLLVPYTYLPFGLGPRNCLGMRYVYQTLKLTMAFVITRYCFEPNKHTPAKLQFVAGHPLVTVKQIPVQICRRS